MPDMERLKARKIACAKIRPGLNGLHVHEDPLRAEAINQAIGQPSGDVSAFPAAITDKNATVPGCAHGH